MSPITGLLPGRTAESLRPRLRRDRHDPVGRTSQIHRNPRTTHQPVLEQLAAPGRVDHVALAPGHVVQMLSVQEPALEAPPEHVEDGLPVDAGRLHPDERHTEAFQPVGQRLELTDRAAEAARLLLAPAPALSVAR